MLRSKTLMGALVAASVVFCAPSHAKQDKVTFGYLETVYLGDLALEMSAKLDSGADFSSVYAREIDLYRDDDDDEWVRFKLVGDDGRTIRFNKKVIRTALIKTKTGGTVDRPVISLRVCINGLAADTPVNLADRSEFDHPFLVGREYLAPRILIDSGQSYTAENECDPVSSEDEEDGVS